MSLSIVIPVYNEGRNIEATLIKIAENTEPFHKTTAIRIVYDFEEDDTLPVIRILSAGYPMQIILQKNSGQGVCNAIRDGLLTSKTDYVLVTMADMSDDYQALGSMLEKAEEGYDVVCGSRYMRGGHQYGGPVLKKTLSRIAGVSLYYLSGIPTHDVTNSYKLYRRSMLESIEIESNNGFVLGMEIAVKAYISGFMVTEIPSSWWDRSEGDSRFKLVKWMPLYLHWYFYTLLHSKEPRVRRD